MIDELLGQGWALWYWKSYKQHIINIQEEAVMELIGPMHNNILKKNYLLS